MRDDAHPGGRLYGKLESRGPWRLLWATRNDELENEKPELLFCQLHNEPDSEDVDVGRVLMRLAEEILLQREMLVFHMRIVMGFTLKECAERQSVTTERIRQIEAKVIRKVRSAAWKAGIAQ